MEKYWFRKRRGLFTKDFGWGWMPISREGWLFASGIILYIIVLSLVFLNLGLSDLLTGILISVNIFLAMTFSVIVSIKKCSPG